MEPRSPNKGWLDLTPEELIEALNNLGPDNFKAADREIRVAIGLTFPNQGAELWGWLKGIQQKGPERQ